MLTTPAPPSFDLVCAAYRTAIYKKIRRYLYDDAIVEDLHQEVLIKIWRKLSSYDSTKGTLYSWIKVITVNTCIDHLRTMQRTVVTKPEFNGDLVHEETDAADFALRRELLWLADKLSGCQKTVVLLIYFRGYTQNEVAQLLKLPLGTVKSRQRAALLALRKMCQLGIYVA